MPRLARTGLALALALAGCTKSSSDPELVDAPGSGSGGGDGGTSGDGFTTLISRAWTIPAGTFDKYECTRIAVPRDMWIAGFRRVEQTASTNVVGTHHQVLTVSQGSSPVGDYDCTAGSLDRQMLYAAGLGTGDLVFPDGYAVHLTAGTYINLNLHLFNSGDSPITGTSGIAVKELPAGSTPKEIDFEFAGNAQFTIPHTNAATSADFDVQGGCTASTAMTLFAMWPHMHQLANHQKLVVAHAGGGADTLLDTDYAFAEQKFYPLAPSYQVAAGDQIQVTCSYRNDNTTNPGGGPVMFGDSSTSEMCFDGYYRYPAGHSIFGCTVGL